MIKSVDEFLRLRTSEIKEDYDRAVNDEAEISTWIEVIEKHPDYKQWVVHNKTVPIKILEMLTFDEDPAVRGAVAKKRKINDKIFMALSKDRDETVRYALICNTKLTSDQLQQIETGDSDWLNEQLEERLEKIGKNE